MFSTRKNRANESKKEEVSTEESILGEEKNRRKKGRNREGEKGSRAWESL